jgi:hypothetical protein
LEKTIRRRQMLLDLTSREVEENVHRLEAEKKKMEEDRVRMEEPANCTETIILPEEQVKKDSRMSGPKVMGVFTLCGLLASLGWGGVTSTLVIASRTWSSRRSDGSMDASTSMSELRPEGSAAGLKPATLSFQEMRVWLEWPKRRTPPRRKVRGIPRRGKKKHEAKEEKKCEEQASWGECS